MFCAALLKCRFHGILFLEMWSLKGKALLNSPPKALPLETARALPLSRKPLKRLDLNFMFLLSE